MEYYIRINDGSQEKVTGRPVKIEGLNEYDFFYRKDEEGAYVITEVTTGRSVSLAGTLKQARANAADRINRNKEQFIATLAEGGIT